MADSRDRPVERVALVATVSVTVLFEAGTLVLSRGVAPRAPVILYACYSVIQVLAGALVVWAHPRHRVGWLLVITAAFNAAVSDFALAYGERAAHEGWAGADLAQMLGWSAWIIAALGLTLLFLWSPTGWPRRGLAGSPGCGPWERCSRYRAGSSTPGWGRSSSME